VKSDLLYAWRAIWASPITSIGAILALALGMGATISIFGLLNAVFLRPLPYPEPDRLVELWGTVERELQVERRGTSFPDYFDWRDRTRSFDGVAAWVSMGFVAYGGGEPTRVNAEVVDGPYFELLGARALHGRLLRPEDHSANAMPVAVIGERLWEERFGRSFDAVGRVLQLDSRVFTIVGVVPASFLGRSDQAVVWVPVRAAAPPAVLEARGSRGFAPIARLGSGVTLAAAQDDLRAVCARLEKEYPETNERRSADVVPLAGEIFQTVRPAISMLFAAVVLVLLIACANVASLLLARSEARRREMSLRRALGAGYGRLVRLLFLESIVLVVLGGTAGWLVGQWMQDGLLALSPVRFPSYATPATDWRTILFVGAVGVLTTIGIGLTPIGCLRGASLAQALREGAVAARGGDRASPLRLIVVGEVALAVALLVGAALFGRSFAALVDFNPGFKPAGVLTMRVQFPPAAAVSSAGNVAPAAPAGMQDVGALTLLDDLRGLPDVLQAGLTTSVPLREASAIFYAAEGMPPVDATNRPRAYVHRITPGLLDTLGVRILEGRDFTRTELGLQSTAVIVSQNVARRFWPGASAIGRRIKQGDLASQSPWLTIVGVVQEANLRSIPRNPTGDPDLYLPFNDGARAFAVVLRTDRAPSALAGSARAALQRARPGLAVFQVQSLDELVDNQLAAARFLSWITGAFAAVALVLVVIGVYGLLSYWVRRRTTELGIRTALGANRGRLLTLVVSQALALAGAGIALGVVLAIVLSRFVEAQLFGVRPLDWVSLVGTAAVMLAAAFLASLAPALRVLRMDPVAALRFEQ
jgi:putative ABC transport system permease protein